MPEPTPAGCNCRCELVPIVKTRPATAHWIGPRGLIICKPIVKERPDGTVDIEYWFTAVPPQCIAGRDHYVNGPSEN